MIQIHAKEKKCIDLGRRGEDSAREILFDISGWAELYGQGEAQLIAKRDRDLDSYPASITQNDTTVSWVIKPVDNDQPGYGQCELVYITDGSVVKSIIYQTHTDISLSDPVSPPNSPSTYGSLLTRIEALEKNNTGGVSGGVEETDPTVPDWAKSKTKPEYTAEEVGALSADTLPEAINDALAQAKKSGEFDGKDYVLNEADITKIAEQAANLVEVPESGGIKVTGAKVGQTIVVKATNDKGVPTECGTIDIYSKPQIDAIMGSYINDINTLIGGDS